MIFDPEALALALDQRRIKEGLSWREVARQVDVAPSTLTRLAQGDCTHITVIVRLMLWLGETDLKPYLVGDP